jgi:cob(I)alamin adenosyltransferase
VVGTVAAAAASDWARSVERAIERNMCNLLSG